MSVFVAIFRSLRQIGDARFRRILIKSIGLTLVLLLSVFTAATFGLIWLLDTPWVTTSVVAGLGFFTLLPLLYVFLMVPTAAVVTSLYMDEVSEIVESRYYPQLERTAVPFLTGLRAGVSFLGLFLVANLLGMVLYLLLLTLLLPFLSVFIFWGINGFLLGREYFNLVALRRMERKAVDEMVGRHRFLLWVVGSLMLIPLSIPLLSLVMPILGVATFTHLFHSLAETPKGDKGGG